MTTFAAAKKGRRFGGLAQLARAPALHAGGQRFESVILHPLPHKWQNGSLTCWNRREERRNLDSTENERINQGMRLEGLDALQAGESKKGRTADACGSGRR